jgi:hypothetical protein
MNMVAIWFGIIERQAIHRGAFGDVRELTTAIRTYITGWLQQSSPPLRLDPRPRGNPQESQPSPNFKRGPPLSIEMAKYPLTSGCTGSIPGAGNHPAVRAVIVPRELNLIDFNKRKARWRMNSSWLPLGGMVILPALRCLTGTKVLHIKAHCANLGRAAKTNERDKAWRT